MAQGKRCFSGKITESDAFYALPGNAQALYLHLCMEADHDGFVNNAAVVATRVYGGRLALKKLVESPFLLRFGNIYVIKHWRISNSLRSDRQKPLNFPDLAGKIWIKEDGAYSDQPGDGQETLYDYRIGLTNGCQMSANGMVKRKEKNGKEENGREEKGREARDEVWSALLNAYPPEKLGNLEEAYDAFRQTAGDGRILENLRLWKQSEQWEKEDGKYIPYLVNWIARGAWQRKPEKMAIPKGASGVLGQAELEAIRKILAEDGQ